MSEQPEDRPSLSADEAAFVDRVAEQYAPPALSAQRRAALDAELSERIAAPRWLRLTGPAFAFAAVGLTIGLVMAFVSLDTDRPPPDPVVAERGAADWERGLLDPAAFEVIDELDANDDLEELPDDYAAIAGVFLDG